MTYAFKSEIGGRRQTSAATTSLSRRARRLRQRFVLSFSEQSHRRAAAVRASGCRWDAHQSSTHESHSLRGSLEVDRRYFLEHESLDWYCSMASHARTLDEHPLLLVALTRAAATWQARPCSERVNPRPARAGRCMRPSLISSRSSKAGSSHSMCSTQLSCGYAQARCM